MFDTVAFVRIHWCSCWVQSVTSQLTKWLKKNILVEKFKKCKILSRQT